MKRFAILLSIAGAGLVTIGCSSRTPVLTSRDPFKTDGDPFQAAAAMAQPETAPQSGESPGYAQLNIGSGSATTYSEVTPGWGQTRQAPPAGGMPQEPWQTAALPEKKVQLTFRATSPAESQTQVVNATADAMADRSIPHIGESALREPAESNPFEEGTIQNADFVETEQSPITQLGAMQRSNSPPATLEMPVFADEAAPSSQTQPKPAGTSQEWWDQ